MSLSSISIRRPVFAWTLMFGLIFFGLLSFFRMGINENPDVDFPTIRISYTYDGATPAVIEKDIVEPVESVLVAMEGIRNMSSNSSRGSGSISLEFEVDRDIDFALQEVQTLLGRAQRLLPDAISPPVVTKSNADDDPIVYLNLTAEGLSTRDLMVLFRDQIRDQLSTVEGVAEVRAFGFHEPVLRIDLKADRLRKYHLTAKDVIESIRREHKELPAGTLEYGENEDTLRIMGEATKPEEFQNMIISRRGGSPNYIPLRLADVADVYEGVENIKRISRFNGEPAMGMAIQKQRGVNAASTADKVIAKVDQINTTLPDNVKINVNFDRTQFIRETVNELVFTLILSAILTSIVCWLFLGSWSATMNILLAIPTSIIGTFIFINWMGFTLNTFSLLGLALAIGIVVDDAVIMLENIARYMQKGWDRVNAAFKGSREITFAVIATTLALVSIFFPITLLDGLEGKFFYEFAVTISVAVALSSIEALTLAPMRSSQFLRLEPRKSRFGQGFEYTIDSLRRLYTWTLELCLAHRWKVIFGSLAIFAGSLFVVRTIPTEFVPDQDRGMLFAMLLAPDGRSLEYTTEKLLEFEKVLEAHPNVARSFLSAGGWGGGGQSNRGNGIIILKDQEERDQSQFEIAADLRKEIKKIEGIQIFIRDRFGSPFGGRRGSPIEFVIGGPDPDVQVELYEKMKAAMEESGIIVDVRSDDILTLPEVQIVPNRERALKSGVEISEIADIVNATFGGTVAAQYSDGTRRFDIQVQLQEEDRRKAEQIRNISVRNNRGELIPLERVVDIVPTRGPQSIFREARTRVIRVDGNLTQGASLGDAVDIVREAAAEIIPQNYFIRFSDTPDEKLLHMGMIMGLALIIAYMVLAVQFNSFTDPWIVFLAIPFGLTGSLFALLLGGQTLNIYSAIGILLTMGIVKKNSILLVEFTNQLRDRGRQVNEALLEACPIRLRPILMTTISTLAAAVPPALAIGPGSETRVPMALTIIGGVSLSMFFTLIVVPCVYSVIAPKRKLAPVESPEELSPPEKEKIQTHAI